MTKRFASVIKTVVFLCVSEQVPSLSYPAVAEAALQEGPNWGKYAAPYVV